MKGVEMAEIVQPKLAISYSTSWEAGKIVLEHLMNAPEPPTFTMRRTNGGVQMWMSKRTFEWLRDVLNLDPRAHKEEK